MHTISIGKVLLTLVFLFCTSFSQAQCDGPPYPDDYPFGQDGDAQHPNGYDGYPGDHPDNPNAPDGGSGGDGFGDGDGGCGGDGVDGGDGGKGGDSGPAGGCGGNGGEGGHQQTGLGGAGGRGGDGIDCGGAGGEGGSGVNGGPGGCGGNASGQNGQGGDGGDGGTASSGIGGTGGCGGHATGAGGCGGDAGDGGDAYLETFDSRPGLPGTQGTGVGGGMGDACFGEPGDIGNLINIINPTSSIDIMPDTTRLAYSSQLALVASATPAEFIQYTNSWTDHPGSKLRLAAREYPERALHPDGSQTYKCMLHPNSLLGDILRVTIEAKAIGTNPLLDIQFGNNAEFATTPYIPIPLGDGWLLHQFLIVRPVTGQAMGSNLDMFDYVGRDIDVRFMEVYEIGTRGDVDLNGQINMQDASIVLSNYAQNGLLQLEDGDTNLDGIIDLTDVINVIDAMSTD